MTKRTIAVDFDGVLHSYRSPWVAPHVIPDPPVRGAIEWLRRILAHYDVVILSTRARTWRGRRAIRRWLWTWDTGGPGKGSSFASWMDFNELASIPVTDKKRPAIVYLDDRAMRFEGVFPTAEAIEGAIPWNKTVRRSP